jgi:dTDP-4-amino-4,6-dideoxygalactose transaminase
LESLKAATSSLRKVPFFDYPALFAEIEQEAMDTIKDVLGRGAYIMQRDLLEFESALAQYVGVKHVVGVADGTMALLLALRAMDLERGDEVIVPAHTFVATAAAIHHAGGTPVLVDCREDHLIDPEAVRSAINRRTRGVMPVQLNGRTADMSALTSIADEHDLFIVEDACQALGSTYRGQQAGTFGSAGAISFYPSKTLGCFGDGGAVVTNSDSVAERVRLLRDHGRTGDGDVVAWGYNSRLDNLQAAMLGLKLKRYGDYIERRRVVARLYNERLRSLQTLLLPPAPTIGSDHFDIFQNYEIEADRRDELREFLSERGVSTIIQWGGKTINQFKKLGVGVDLPYTDRMVSRFMMLPMNTALSDDDVHYVCDCIIDFYSD